MYDVVTNAAGNSWMFERMKHVVDGDYTPTSAVDIFVKDLGLVTETGRALGFPPAPGLDRLRDVPAGLQHGPRARG